MHIEVDTHTHTVGSGHSYSTLKENAVAAREAGLRGFVVTDHGPAIPGAGPSFALSSTLRTIPDEIEGVRMFRGTEADIMDTDGSLDIEDQHLAHTDFAVASLHSITFAPGQGEQANTEAMLRALDNPWIDVIGHPGNPRYPIDTEAFVRAVRDLGKLVEINNHSFAYRPGSAPNCLTIIRLCRQYDVRVVVSSDAHSCYAVGKFPCAVEALEQEGFPEELVLNADFDRFSAYVKARADRNMQRK